MQSYQKKNIPKKGISRRQVQFAALLGICVHSSDPVKSKGATQSKRTVQT